MRPATPARSQALTQDEARLRPERVVGHVRGAQPGPTLLVVAGIHGNEPAGIEAGEAVIQRLGEAALPMRGELVVLRGNIPALGAGVRCIDMDLNRMWSPRRVRREGFSSSGEAAEHAEQASLLEAIHAVLERADAGHPIVFIDLHTFSAEGAPFTLAADTLENRHFFLQFPLPHILGLEEQIEGTLQEYMLQYCDQTMVVEGGTHEAKEARQVHEAVFWCALVAAGLLRAVDCGAWEASRELLRSMGRGAPRVCGIRYRHDIEEADGFKMRPGYRNLQRVRKGETLGEDVRGDVVAPESGRIIMPLYQEIGNDGFFLGQAISIQLLRLSGLVRRMRLDRLLLLLPGIRRHPDDPYTLVLRPRIRSLYWANLFHLFGYRKWRRHGNLVLVRRWPPHKTRHDLAR